MMTRPNRWAPVAIALLILFVGGALIRLGFKEQVTARRAAAAAIAAASANSVEQKLAVISTAVDRLTVELTVRKGLDDFRTLVELGREKLPDDTALFLLPAGGMPNEYLIAEGLAVNELKPLKWEDAPNERASEPELIGPVRLGNGERLAFIRSPLFLSKPDGSRTFWGWVAAGVPIDRLLQSAGLDQLPSKGYDYQFGYHARLSNSLRTVKSSLTIGNLNSPVRQSIRPAQDQWVLLMAPAKGWFSWSLLIAELLIVAVIALTAGVITTDVLRHPAQLTAQIEARDKRLREINLRLGQEIEQREELERQLGETTFHDAFTGLPNRSFLIDRLTRALQRSRLEPGYVIAVLILNFVRYKSIIETLGVGAGDQLLTQAVRRIEGCLRPDDLVVARVADDEFATLLFDIGSPQAAAAAAQRLTEVLSEPCVIDGQSVFATAKMGIALSSNGYEDAEVLVRSAHMALSQANDSQAQYAVFDPVTREQLVTRHQLETDLYQAIERNQFRLFYQPIVSLETGSIVGMEALVRWMHPLEGLLPPARFISLAEETGLVVPITRWVLRTACRQAQTWRSRFPADLHFYLSVNLSAQDLKQPDACDFVATALSETQLPAGVLRLEVTESMMIGSLNAVSEIVSRFRAMKVPLLLDDFGTGYSSLSYLNRFHFDFIKIDRAFVNRLAGTDQNSGIVRAIVHLARDMGSKTIAEGVENEQVLEQLRMLGCDYGQGYYFSKPVDAAAAEKLLLSRKSWHPSNSSACIRLV